MRDRLSTASIGFPVAGALAFIISHAFCPHPAWLVQVAAATIRFPRRRRSIENWFAVQQESTAPLRVLCLVVGMDELSLMRNRPILHDLKR
jgi:hypothetical protein